MRSNYTTGKLGHVLGYSYPVFFYVPLAYLNRSFMYLVLKKIKKAVNLSVFLKLLLEILTHLLYTLVRKFSNGYLSVGIT